MYTCTLTIECLRDRNTHVQVDEDYTVIVVTSIRGGLIFAYFPAWVIKFTRKVIACAVVHRKLLLCRALGMKINTGTHILGKNDEF